MTPSDHADMISRITTMVRAGHCMSPQTRQGSQRVPGDWNIQTAAICNLASAEAETLATSMTVDLLFGNFGSSRIVAGTLVPLRMFDTGRSEFAPGKFGNAKRKTDRLRGSRNQRQSPLASMM